MFVYFIQQHSGGLVKIGKSQNPESRLYRLQQASPEPLVIVAVCAGGYPAELQLHRWFADQRQNGEWFKVNETMQALIDRLPTWDAVKGGAFCPELLNNERTVLNELYQSGYTLEDIGDLLGLSRTRVHQIISGRTNHTKWRKWTYDPIARKSFITVDIHEGRCEERPEEPIKRAYERLTRQHSGIDLVLPWREE